MGIYIDPVTQALLLHIGQVLLIFIVGWIVINKFCNLVGHVLGKRYPDAILRAFLVAVLRITTRVLLFTSCLDMLGVSVTSIITALGAVGLALGLAMQESLGNLAQGVMLLFTRPFSLGDYIEVDGLGGTVEDMDMLHVSLCTPDRKRIFLTNSSIARARVVNFYAMPERRLEVVVEVLASESLEKVKELLLQVMRNQTLALPEPAPYAYLGTLSSDTAQIICRTWVPSNSYWKLYYSFLEETQKVFAQEGIICPPGKVLMRLEGQQLP